MVSIPGTFVTQSNVRKLLRDGFRMIYIAINMKDSDILVTLNCIKTFLKENPSEFVMVYIKHQLSYKTKKKFPRNTKIFAKGTESYKLWDLKGKLVVCFGDTRDVMIQRLGDGVDYPFQDHKLNIVISENYVQTERFNDIYSYGSLVCKHADRNLAKNIIAKNYALDIAISHIIESQNEVNHFI
jgi:hypothetical protein